METAHVHTILVDQEHVVLLLLTRLQFVWLGIVLLIIEQLLLEMML